MNSRQWMIRIGWVIGSLAAVGCNGPQFGGDIHVPPDQRTVLESTETTQEPLTLPADRPFNIHMKQSSQNPGAIGQARGESEADPQGQAACRAEASNGGSAMAEFTLGHRVVNETENPLSVTIQLDYQLEQSLQASRIPQAETVAVADVVLMVKDSNKQVLAQMPVLHTTSDDILADNTIHSQQSLSLQFEPNLSYDIILYGKVTASAAQEQEATARVRIRDMTLDCRFDQGG